VATANQFDDETIERAIRRSEELAQLAPDDPIGAAASRRTQYTPVPAATAKPPPRSIPSTATALAESSIGPAKAKGCVAAGFLHGRSQLAGDGQYHRPLCLSSLPQSQFLRDHAERGRHRVRLRQADYNDAARFNGAASSQIAVDKAMASLEAVAIEPGKYTVYHGAHRGGRAVCKPLIPLRDMDARSADERAEPAVQGRRGHAGRGRTSWSATGLGSWSDSDQRGCADLAVGQRWPAYEKTKWIDKGGGPESLLFALLGREARASRPPDARNIIMGGGPGPLARPTWIKDTARGILVTRFW